MSKQLQKLEYQSSQRKCQALVLGFAALLAVVGFQHAMQLSHRPPRGAVWLDYKELAHASSEGPSVCNPGTAAGLHLNVSNPTLVSPLVIVAHNRVNYLATTMMILLRYWSADAVNVQRFPLFISVDGGDQCTLQFAAAWKQVCRWA